MKKDIIVTGSLAYDYIMDFPGSFSDRIVPEKIHNLSLSFLVDTLKKQFGGCAGNIAYTLNLLGETPHIMACVGNDFSPYFQFLRDHRIDASGVKLYKDVLTGSYFGITDKNDNQIGSFYTGASRYAVSLSLAPLVKKYKNPFVVISPTDPKAMVSYVTECIKLKLPYLFDPAFQIATFSVSNLKRGIINAAVLIGNDYEISLIEKQLTITHTQLLGMVPVVITTLGAKGSVIEQRDKTCTIRPAKAKNACDPTGAGDAYRAGFLAGYLRGFDLRICGQMGSVAAVYTVEKYGTVTHRYTKKEFIRRYVQNFKTGISL